jgi:glucosamine--fructose-6-phosphate aminotransferase (isomerizing)
VCGIVAVAARRDCSEILLEGLRRLEYRGYDSAGFALIDREGQLSSHKTLGRVAALEAAQQAAPLSGGTGIAHTRWATHGAPSVANAHPHVIHDRIALVHNGIIENHELLRSSLTAQGCQFASETDTEVVAHLIALAIEESGHDLLAAVQQVLPKLQGAYALAVIDRESPNQLVVARQGSPLVLGVGLGEYFAGSDTLALQSVTDTFIYLEEGDVAQLTADGYAIFNVEGQPVDRGQNRLALRTENQGLGGYDHYMRKEIFEQPARLQDTIRGASANDRRVW